MARRKRNNTYEEQLTNTVKIKPKTENQKTYLESIDKNKVIFCEGPAGTGKTTLATLKGIENLLNGTYYKLLISRPTVESGRSIGLLPGTIQEKLLPYAQPVMDVLETSFSHRELDDLQTKNQVEITSISYLRGRNFYNSYVIIDEAQNCTYDEIVLILTRFSKNSKIVLTGDSSQSDLPIDKQGGFATIRKTLVGVKDVDSIILTENDIVRDPVVKDILDKLNASKEKTS